MAGLSSSGHINTPEFISVLKNIAVLKVEGIMKVESGKFKKELYFKNGLLVGGRSNILKETFGRVLFENGLVSQPDYEDSLKEVLAKKKRHGAVLQERGLLPININDALKLQLRMRFVYTFSMSDGIFHFREAVLPENVLSQYSMSLFNLIAEGVKLHMPKPLLLEYGNDHAATIYAKGRDQYDPALLNLTQAALDIFDRLCLRGIGVRVQFEDRPAEEGEVFSLHGVEFHCPLEIVVRLLEAVRFQEDLALLELQLCLDNLVRLVVFDLFFSGLQILFIL